MSSDKSRTFNRAKREYTKSFDCEICGKQNATVIAIIEGAKMAVCAYCGRFGKTVHTLSDGSEVALPSTPSISPQETEDIVENYGKIMKQARDKLGVPLKVLAERMREREGYLEKIERGQLMPSLTVAKKLERELGIKIIEKGKVVPTHAPKGIFQGFTLADIATQAKPKKK